MVRRIASINGHAVHERTQFAGARAKACVRDASAGRAVNAAE
jgi:hypothetical protein